MDASRLIIPSRVLAIADSAVGIEGSVMTIAEERLKILNLIQAGKITPEEGLRLLEALEQPDAARPVQPATGAARWLRVMITDLISGKTRVNVRLPVTVLNTGIKMGARFSTDIGQMEMGQIMDAVRSGSIGKILDVIDDEDNEHIQIYLE
jgi:DNA-directed RNA polymerase sigma subunit (sigma70/sigma32)